MPKTIFSILINIYLLFTLSCYVFQTALCFFEFLHSNWKKGYMRGFCHKQLIVLKLADSIVTSSLRSYNEFQHDRLRHVVFTNI